MGNCISGRRNRVHAAGDATVDRYSRNGGKGGLEAEVMARLDALSQEVSDLKRQLQAQPGGWVATGGGGDAQAAAGGAQEGLCYSGPRSRADFLTKRWLPFISELRGEMTAARTRSVGGFSPEQILPAQEKMHRWTATNLELTALWYGGEGNMACMYEFMVEAATLDPTCPYRFEAVPQQRSEDHFVRVLDGMVRSSFYGKAGGEQLSHEDIGGMKQDVAESHIANTELPNIMSAAESRVLLAGGAMKNLLIKRVASRQKKVLTSLQQAFAQSVALREYAQSMAGGGAPAVAGGGDSVQATIALLEECDRVLRLLEDSDAGAAMMQGDKGANLAASGAGAGAEEALDLDAAAALVEEGRSSPEAAAAAAAGAGGRASPSPSEVAEMASVVRRVLRESGVPRDSLSWVSLVQRGRPLASYGQLSTQQKKDVHKYLKQELGEGEGGHAGTGAAGDEKSQELHRFVQFCRDHPGSIWQDDVRLHKKMVLMVSLSKEYKVVSREEVDKHTVHRHLAVPWTRSVPLVMLDEQGAEQVLREPQSEEKSRFRQNKFPYADSHGISVSSGGAELRVGASTRDLTKSGSAKLGNWWLTDIEKICVEAERLNPGSAPQGGLLPYEAYHEVGQNTRAASSIGATQHTQVTRGTAGDWPFFCLSNRPMHCPELACSLDICQVGEEPDGFFVRLSHVARPSDPRILELLTQLRLMMLREFGGHNVDFDVHALKEQPTFNKQDSHVAGGPGGAGGRVYAGGCPTQGFIVTFAPVAPMQWQQESRTYLNPATGKSSSDGYDLPCETVDSSQGKGNILCGSKAKWDIGLEGRPVLERLYDFNALPGARRSVRAFLLRRFAFVDAVGKASLPHGHAMVHTTAEGEAAASFSDLGLAKKRKPKPAAAAAEP